MKRSRFIMVLACLMLLSGCSRSDQDTFDEVPDSSNTLPQPVSEVPDKDTIEYNTTLYNYIETVIDEVRIVNGSTSSILAENMQPGDRVWAQWDTAEQDLSEQGGESPYFILVVSGQEIPITVARLADKEMYEELYITLDEIAFFHTDNIYYFSPQADYPDREKSPGMDIVPTQYLYLPQVQRWLRQREGQLLFAAGLTEEEIHTYFPEYKDDIPLTTCAAMISCETIYLEDVHAEVATESGTVTEIRESEELQIFTTDDVIVIPVDHVRLPELYFRYQDAQGNVHRQYVMDQSRDNNNGTITSHMLTSDDEYYELVPLESHGGRDYSDEADQSRTVEFSFRLNEGFTGWDNLVWQKGEDIYYTSGHGIMKWNAALDEADLMISEEGIDGIVIDGSWLYYQKSTEKEICRINLNGDYSKEIVFSVETIDNPEVLEHLTGFTLYNGELFIKEKTITCFRYDIEKNQLVSFNDDMSSGAFLDNMFYYTDHAQRTYSIYTTDLDSLQTELVRGDGTSYKPETAEKTLFCDKLTVVNGRLIYSTRVNPAIYIYEENGEDLLIEDLRGEDVMILDTTTDGQYYYYSHQNSNILRRYDLNQDELELIELPENFRQNNGYMIIDDNLYYRSDHETYKILLEEKQAFGNMIQ